MCNLFVFSSSPFALHPRPRAPSYTLSSIVLPISSPAYFTSHIISVRLSPSPLSPTCPYFTSRSHSVIQKYLGDNLVCIQPGRDLHRRHNVAVAGMPCMRPHPASKPLHTHIRKISHCRFAQMDLILVLSSTNRLWPCYYEQRRINLTHLVH